MLNTSDSYIRFTLKMESVTKNTIFGLKMMVKSSLEKIFLKFLHAEKPLFSKYFIERRPFLQIQLQKWSSLRMEGIQKITLWYMYLW